MSERLDRADEVLRVGHETLNALLKAQTGLDGDSGWIDPDLSIEVLTFLLASLIENLPEYATARDLRLKIEATCSHLRALSKSMRAEFEEKGHHMLENFGAMNTPEADLPRA